MEKRKLNTNKLLHLLVQLESDTNDYLSIYASPLSFPNYVVQAMVQSGSQAEDLKEAIASDALLREAEQRTTGAVIFWSQSGYKKIILPPFPLTEDKLFCGKPQTSLLQQLLRQEHVSGIVLVAWGSYGLGVFKGDKPLEYKTGTGFIHKRHRKGGRSQKRFARRTEEQKKDFLRKVANHIDEKFKVYNLERIFFGGNRLLLQPLLEESLYLSSKADRIYRSLLDVRHVNRETLLKSEADISSSLVFEF